MFFLKNEGKARVNTLGFFQPFEKSGLYEQIVKYLLNRSVFLNTTPLWIHTSISYGLDRSGVLTPGSWLLRKKKSQNILQPHRKWHILDPGVLFEGNTIFNCSSSLYIASFKPHQLEGSLFILVLKRHTTISAKLFWTKSVPTVLVRRG